MAVDAAWQVLKGHLFGCIVFLLRGSVEADISQQAITCEKFLAETCLNATRVGHSLNGKDSLVWSRVSLGNAIPVCRFYSPPSARWHHVCQQNRSVFLVTNASEEGVTFRFEISEQPLHSERKKGKGAHCQEHDADLNIAQMAWGDSKNNTMHIPSDSLQVVFAVLGVLLFSLLIAICLCRIFRVSLGGMMIARPAVHVGCYKMIKHKLDCGNEINPRSESTTPEGPTPQPATPEGHIP